MYIEPNTNIYLLKNVPLDTTYNHTIYFNDSTEQASYFSSLNKVSLANYTYQRVEKGVSRVGIKADSIYDCNYMMFKNASYGDKWFYAFIKSIEYINNGVSEIKFELDVMQTWYFDYDLKECFVLYEHSVTDEVGDNIVDEGLDFGKYCLQDKLGEIDLNEQAWMAQFYPAQDVEDLQVGKVNGLYTCLNTRYGYGSQGLRDFIVECETAKETVACIYQMPKYIMDLTDEEKTDGHIDTNVDVRLDKIGTYFPKNKKLFCYPYNMITVNDRNGNLTTYYVEMFSNPNSVTFRSRGSLWNGGCLSLNPIFYKGINDNYDEGIFLNNFPLVPYTYNAYEQWFAENQTAMTTATIQSVVNTVGSNMVGYAMGSVGVASGNPMLVAGGISAMASSTMGTIHNLVNNKADVDNKEKFGNQLKGQINTANVHLANNKNAIVFYQVTISEEYARIIDDHMTMYGYKTLKVKVPNRSSRPHWNYVQTSGCVAVGSVPSDDMKSICSIYDKGITFWKSGDEVGNYQLDNSPVSTVAEEEA